MLYPCICNVVISCWKSGAYGFVICRVGTDMCFVPGSGWKHLDLEQYRISGLTLCNDKISIICKPRIGKRLYFNNGKLFVWKTIVDWDGIMRYIFHPLKIVRYRVVCSFSINNL